MRRRAPQVGRHGSHAALPPDDGRPRRSRNAIVSVLAAVVALNLAVVVGLAAVGVTVLPASGSGGAGPAPPAAVPVADTTGVLPARTAVTQILAVGPGAGWRAAGPVTWAAGLPVDFACPATSSAAPVVSGSRLFTTGGRSVTVVARAYAAGQGAVAFTSTYDQWRSCSGANTSAGVWSASGPAVDDMTGWVSGSSPGGPSSSLLWRRGDVIVAVSHNGTDPGGLASSAQLVDRGVTTALAGVCADVSSTLADAARSPWADPSRYQGFQVPTPVEVPPVLDPAPPAGVIPVPDNIVVPTPPAVTLPPMPAGSVSPSALPSLLPAPIPPVAPSPAPSQTSVLALSRDETGPGCGWAFTGQAVPPYDASAASAALTVSQSQAQDDLRAAQAQRQQQIVLFWQQYSVYSTELSLFTQYANQVNQTALAWAAIQASRDNYTAALLAYNQAVAARGAFLSAQAAAQAQYDADLSICATAVPQPTDTPTPSPTGAVDPSATPTPTPTDIPTAAPSCPPYRPSILDQPAPTVPPKPVPAP